MTPNDLSSTTLTLRARSRSFRFAALSLALVSGFAVLGMARCFQAPPSNPAPTAPTAQGVKLPPFLFNGWTKPDFVLLVSGQQHGYLMPCGCSHPQKGGLERRYNLLKLLEKMGWPVVPVDLGDVPQLEGPAKLNNIQGLIKYRYSMMALREMKYAAVSFGAYEYGQPLTDCFDLWCLNEEQPPTVAANFLDKEGIYKSKTEHHIKDVAFRVAAGVNVGITALLAPSVTELKMKDRTKFDIASSAETLPRVFKEMDDAKVGLKVLLYQGSLTQGMKGRDPEAIELVKKFPQFNVVLCLSEEDEPRSTPVMLRNTMAVSVGHKARYVGVIGVWKNGKSFDLKYQLVELGEEFMTPKGEEAAQPVLALMEKYTAELKRDNYLARYPQAVPPNNFAMQTKGGKPAQYVGSEACIHCHEDAYKKWKSTPHSHAYKTLVDAKNPSLREHDPECIVCHTVGFGYQTGFRDADTTPKLKNVGCESCHGPASEHIAAQQNLAVGKPAPLAQEWRDVMNPWRTPDEPETELQRNKRILRADSFCQSCHDKDNDVTWLHNAFERKWLKIWHYEDTRKDFKNREKLIEEFTKKEAVQKK